MAQPPAPKKRGRPPKNAKDGDKMPKPLLKKRPLSNDDAQHLGQTCICDLPNDTLAKIFESFGDRDLNVIGNMDLGTIAFLRLRLCGNRLFTSKINASFQHFRFNFYENQFDVIVDRDDLKKRKTKKSQTRQFLFRLYASQLKTRLDISACSQLHTVEFFLGSPFTSPSKYGQRIRNLVSLLIHSAMATSPANLQVFRIVMADKEKNWREYEFHLPSLKDLLSTLIPRTPKLCVLDVCINSLLQSDIVTFSMAKMNAYDSHAPEEDGSTQRAPCPLHLLPQELESVQIRSSSPKIKEIWQHFFEWRVKHGLTSPIKVMSWPSNSKTEDHLKLSTSIGQHLHALTIADDLPLGTEPSIFPNFSLLTRLCVKRLSYGDYCLHLPRTLLQLDIRVIEILAGEESWFIQQPTGSDHSSNALHPQPMFPIELIRLSIGCVRIPFTARIRRNHWPVILYPKSLQCLEIQSLTSNTTNIYQDRSGRCQSNMVWSKNQRSFCHMSGMWPPVSTNPTQELTWTYDYALARNLRHAEFNFAGWQGMFDFRDTILESLIVRIQGLRLANASMDMSQILPRTSVRVFFGFDLIEHAIFKEGSFEIDLENHPHLKIFQIQSYTEYRAVNTQRLEKLKVNNMNTNVEHMHLRIRAFQPHVNTVSVDADGYTRQDLYFGAQKFTDDCVQISKSLFMHKAINIRTQTIEPIFNLPNLVE